MIFGRLLMVLALAVPCFGQSDTIPAAASASGGWPALHDPSTVIKEGATYYVFATGRDIPVFSSPDARHWTRRGSVLTAIPESVHSQVPANDGHDVWAPDVIHLGDTFFLYYSVSKWGPSTSAVGLLTSPTLDPASPAYHWTDRGVVAKSSDTQDLNAIDPGVTLSPDGTLWLSYGSYRGPIQVVQLDPRTGLRLHPETPATAVATHSEASDIIFHAGYFYLFVNHGSCCRGSASTYNIHVGRSRQVTGPYLDRAGKPLTEVAGEPFLATDGEQIGPGHFGLIRDKVGAPERFSMHYESDPAAGGKSSLRIRLLTWSSDGWPVAGALVP